MNLINFTAVLAQAAQPNPQGTPLLLVGYLVIFVLIFYFMAIRPQSKKQKAHDAMVKSMKPGDKVVTSGGVVGTLVSVKEKTVSLRSADTKLEVLKSAISDITERGGESSTSES